MNDIDLLTDDAVLSTLGERLAGARLALDVTQADLAREAGVSKRTVERLEAGHSTQTVNLVRVLRALGLLGGLDVLVPVPEPTPMQLLRRRGKTPRRASGRASGADEPWSWGDDDE